MSDRDSTSEIVTEFLVESHEGLDGLDRDLLTLEQQGADAALLARIFRCVHTIKGTCGFLGFGKLESVTHVGEGLLSRLRDGEITVSPALTAALLALVDATREMLAGIERDGHEGDGERGGAEMACHAAICAGAGEAVTRRQRAGLDPACVPS